MSQPRRAGVLGSPIAHSRSRQLHLAAYRELGLAGWTYHKIECTADELAPMVAGFGPEWVGLSVTMPNKFAALAFADERTERAELLGSANTLVHTSTGWRADNTDVDGVTGALHGLLTDPGSAAIVLGSGGTAPAAVMGLIHLGVKRVNVVARNPDRAAPLVLLGTRLGGDARWVGLDTATLDGAAVVVNTVPADVAARYASAFAEVPVLLDAIYEPWPTPLAAAVMSSGGRAVGGLQMLLNQAYAQVEQFTGLPAPRKAMAATLR